MSLPYLPCEHIVPAFEQLKLQAEEVGGPILNVVMYMQRTWIRGSMWTPDNWSVYRQTVRTNNDVEGWHRRINGRAGRPDLGFYVLVPLLRREAETADLTIRLVSEHALTRVHRKIFKEVHGRHFEIWEKYEDDDMTTTQLLRACSHIIGLGPSTTQDDIHDEDF
ncbi:uncharacterized protein LOC127870010 [Dreissena polymorpha]|uniref:uncharacterized protein LOC127870010 n=1 Tax=Dreissena polymorpha TaxID=45954 RepID=UPI0022651250|nr:uncharacterized protein LOC127870010 [Dreissena polymorpha]